MYTNPVASNIAPPVAAGRALDLSSDTKISKWLSASLMKQPFLSVESTYKPEQLSQAWKHYILGVLV